MDAATALLITTAGILGLALGSFANVVAVRLPAGVPLSAPSRCDSCKTPIEARRNVPVVSWVLLRGRCAHCRTAIPRRVPIVEAATGIALAGLALWFAGRPGAFLDPAWWVELTAFAFLAVTSIILVLVDLDTHRLPDAVVLPGYPVAIVLLIVARALDGRGDAVLRAAAGMVLLFAAYALLRLVRPDAMGGGDVKLAGLLGWYLGWIGWSALVVGAFAAFLYGAAYGIVLILRGRARRDTPIPFGPWMLLGAWTGIVFGAAAWAWYRASWGA